MIDQTPRDPWRAIWRVAISDHLIATLLLGTAAGLALTAWLPQMPAGDPVAYARWLSQAQARFGTATPTLQALGAFTITSSILFRVLLAILAGCLLLRLIEGSDRLQRSREMATPAGEWRALADVCLPDALDGLSHRPYRVLRAPPIVQVDRWPWGDMFPLLAYSGALLLLAGLLITNLWGSRVEGLVVQSGEQVTLPDSQGWVTLDRDGSSAAHSPGIVTYFEERGPGVRIAAFDSAERPLPLLQTTDAEPVTHLTVALTEDQYFAIPEAQLIVRLTPQPGHAMDAHSPVLVQVYRSPPGRLATESVVEGDAELAVGDVTLELTSVPYARLTVTRNPGLWPTGLGLVLLGTGMLGSAAWPSRQFWLREEADHVECCGDLRAVAARIGEG